MGYTHYWKFKGNPIELENGKKKFKKAVRLVKACFARLPENVEVEVTKWNSDYTAIIGSEKKSVPLVLAGWNGEGKPEITDTLIRFNGNPDYETCVVALNDTDYGFNFCKTGRQPYDVAVCIVLMCFKEAFGDDFSYSSDGDIEGGEEGWALAKEITGKVFSE